MKFITKFYGFFNTRIEAFKNAVDGRDFLFCLGLLMLGYGLFLLRPWLGFSVPGAIMVCISLFIGQRGK